MALVSSNISQCTRVLCSTLRPTFDEGLDYCCRTGRHISICSSLIQTWTSKPSSLQLNLPRGCCLHFPPEMLAVIKPQIGGRRRMMSAAVPEVKKYNSCEIGEPVSLRTVLLRNINGILSRLHKAIHPYLTSWCM